MRDRSEYLNQLISHTPGDPPVANTDIPQIEAALPPCWRVVGCWHLSGEQNQGKHNIYVDLLDGDGNLLAPPIPYLLAFDWGGMRQDEKPQPVQFDKRPPEPAANVPVWTGRVRVWIEGGQPASDRVSDLSTDFPGAGGNSYGHHSYYVVFQETEATTAPIEPPPTPPIYGGEITSGQRPPTSGGDKPPSSPPTQPPPLSNRLASPVPPGTPVTQGWGEHPEEYAGFGYLGHNGIDYGCPVGTPITATDGGTVERARYDNSGYGLYVMLRHGWGWSLYAHLSEVATGVGQSVKQSQVIAWSGATGNVTGPHLHFGIKKNGFNPVDGWGGYSDPTLFQKEGMS